MLTTAATSYITLFHEYILGALEQSLDCVRVAEPLVSEAEREQAWHLLSFALNVDPAWPLVRDLLLALAPKMEQAGFRDEWLPYLEEGLRQSERQADRRTAAELHLQIGLLYRLQSKFAEARAHLAVSIENFIILEQMQNQARALNELAYTCFLQQHHTKAEQLVESALNLLDESDPERAMSYRIRGVLALEYSRWQEAEENHRKSLELCEKQGDKRRIAWCLQNLGYALRGQEKFTEAITCYKYAAEMLDNIQDKYHWAIVQINLGLAYRLSNQPDEALACHLQGEKVFSKRLSKNKVDEFSECSSVNQTKTIQVILAQTLSV
jgi:tetratricopeptide (TPR) repeat protein